MAALGPGAGAGSPDIRLLKLKLALNLCKGNVLCHRSAFWSWLKRGFYSPKVIEVA